MTLGRYTVFEGCREHFGTGVGFKYLRLPFFGELKPFFDLPLEGDLFANRRLWCEDAAQRTRWLFGGGTGAISI